jgi:hypothetical protein
MGELRFYRDESKGLVIKDRYISLEDGMAEDPEALAVQEGQHQAWSAAVTKFRNELLDSQTNLTYSLGGGKAARSIDGYVSSQACAGCHQAAYIAWANSPHALSMNVLNSKPLEVDTSCFNCHATARTRNTKPVLQNVQCERCHGPGAEHVAKPGKGYGRIADLRSNCSSCHTPATSAAFELNSYWARIKH